jgi:hypothetical protein
MAADTNTLLRLPLLRDEMFTARRTLDLLKVNEADFIRRDRVSALRTYRFEHRLNLFEFDRLLSGHLPTLALDYRNCIVRL